MEEYKEKERQRKKIDKKLKIRWLAHNFNFISICFITYNCVFNTKIKLLPTYNGGTGNQRGSHPIGCTWL